ncbi:MAG: protein kinase [Gammaproteobacteria bacterium]|nr:protein kinase [Gammaproteobacteria bacterium]
MEFSEIAAKLGLDNTVSKDDLQQAAQQKLDKVVAMAEKAPTPELRNKYLTVQAEMQQILSLLANPSFAEPSAVADDAERVEPVISTLTTGSNFTQEPVIAEQVIAEQVNAAAPIKPAPVAPASSPLSQTKLADLPQFGAGFAQENQAALQFKAGDVLAGRFRIEECIGIGGMGAVYRAFDKNRDQSIAVKVLLPALLSSTAAKERFLDEARISSQLSHPNIVNVFDVQNDGDLYFITMELLEGQNLRQYLENLELTKQSMSVDEALAIARDVCEGLQHAHEYTVHRDIKPENIWITGEGKIKIMDFGIARVMNSSQMTKTGAAMGTAYYMAPEQLKGRTDIDGRADQYAVGVMLYEMISGHVPAGRVDSLNKINKDVSKHLSDVVDQMLSGNPDERFASIKEAQEEFLKKKSGFGFGNSKPKAKSNRKSAQAGSGNTTKLVLAASVVVALGLGGLHLTGNLIPLWDQIRPYSQEEINGFKADAATAEGKLKTLNNRLEGARDAVKTRLQETKFEARQTESELGRASAKDKKAIEQKLAEQQELQRVLEAQEELLTTYLIDSNRRGEINGRATHAKDLMQTKAYKESLAVYQEAVAGYEDLLRQADASENVARYKAASAHERSIWQSTAPKYDIKSIPATELLEKDLTAATEFLSKEAFADAAPLLEKVAVGYAAATKSLIAGAEFKPKATKAKASWLAYAKSKGLQTKFTDEYGARFDKAEQQWGSGDLVPAGVEYQALFEQYSELENASRNAGEFRARASKAKTAWEAFRSQRGLKHKLNEQYAGQFAKAEADFKAGEVVGAAKSFADLDRGYQKLNADAQQVLTAINQVAGVRKNWGDWVSGGFATQGRGAEADALFGEAEKLNAAGSWADAAARYNAATNSYATATNAAKQHYDGFNATLQQWQSEVNTLNGQISQWQNAIYSRQNEISNEQGNANQDCSMSTLGAVAEGLNSAACEMGCTQNVFNGTYYEMQTDQYCISNCRSQAQDRMNQLNYQVESCQNDVNNANNRINSLQSDINNYEAEMSAARSRLSSLEANKPVFQAY